MQGELSARTMEIINLKNLNKKQDKDLTEKHREIEDLNEEIYKL